ncbi:MAG: OsmC family peroxiredoxin [Chloroflexi bacterium]|nr:MAG: OsmC family peroxiredoxin [Chloroflexota bacterium]
MSEAKGYRAIEVVAEASPAEKLRKQVVAGQPGNGSFAFIADEGNYMPGGEGAAPTPLTYFVSGVALCLLSHVTEIAAKKKLTLKDARVKVSAKFHEQGSVLQGTKEGACDGFDIAIEIEADEPQEEIKALMQMAHNTCFAEDALTNKIPINFNDRLNEQAL